MNSLLTLLPQPFDWIKIPAGNGTLQADANIILTIPDQDYWIAKYPTTNAQFVKFVEAGGYENERWWPEDGWHYRQAENWTAPRSWIDADFNQSTQPVIDISWYEALAFCLWLSDIVGEKITLPTEAQWQYAAQSTDGRIYPWGNTWDTNHANSAESDIGKTTPVTEYEGKGDSPFGVVDMAGNVWEWCLADEALHSHAEHRTLCGGSWFSPTDKLHVAVREWESPTNWEFDIGFRLARLLYPSST